MTAKKRQPVECQCGWKGKRVRGECWCDEVISACPCAWGICPKCARRVHSVKERKAWEEEWKLSQSPLPPNNAIDNLEVVEFGAHTAEHHAGSRKSYEARRSMEAFALLREELKAERALKAELLEALQVMVRDYTASHADGGSLEMQPAILQASQAIARATGESK